MTENMRHLKRLMFSITALADLGQEVTSSKDLSAKMKAALFIITGIFSTPNAALFNFSARSGKMTLVVAKGYRDKTIDKTKLAISARGIAQLSMNAPHLMRDLSAGAFYRGNRASFAKLEAEVFLPLFVKDSFIGAVVLGKKLGGTPYSAEEKDFLRVIAHQMAVTLYNAQLFLELARKATENRKLYRNMQKIYNDTIQAFAAAIDAKDGYTKDHSYRVASYAVAIAKELGWKKKDVEGIYVAGLLHDIGKIIIDTHVIKKGQQLSEPEMLQIRRHPQISYDILSKIKFPWKNIESFVLHHHERLDGKGYPDALRSQELNDGAKILALVDAFDAMTTNRPYRDRLGLDEAFREVINCSGTQFDEKITKTFFSLLLKELSGEVKRPQILPLLEEEQLSSLRLAVAAPAA